MKRFLSAVGTMGAAATVACGGSSGPGFLNPFPGTCLEALYSCFQASGTGTCSYDARTGVATLTFTGGAKITSASGGTQENRLFGPTGPLCFSVARGASDSIRTYSGQGVEATVVDSGGATVEVTCRSAAPQNIARPAYNPAQEDLRRCVIP